MKTTLFACVLFALILSGCEAWTVEPLPYLSPTPFNSPTPVILSATPILLPLPFTATAGAPTGTPALTPTAALGGTDTQAPPASMRVTSTTTAALTLPPPGTSAPGARVNTQILGCNTSIDIVHAMGEVTNAYITIQNVGQVDLGPVCATLNAQDEGRPHPDKTKCVASLPAGDQVSEKLTVDTTLGKPSPVQVDVTSGAILLQRVAQGACKAVDLLPPNMGNLGSVVPIPAP